MAVKSWCSFCSERFARWTKITSTDGPAMSSLSMFTMSTKCSVPNCHNTTKTGHLLMEFPNDSRMKEFWMEAMKRVNWSPLRKGRICEVHFTRGDWFVCGSKRLLKSTAIPSIFATTTSRKKVLQKKRKCRLADELMLLNFSEVLKGGTKVNVSEQTMVQVERNLVAEHNHMDLIVLKRNENVYIRFQLRDAHDPLDISIEAFVELYRMPQDIFLGLLEFLCALSFYATGTYQEHNGTAMHHPMSQASVSYCIGEITNALNHPLVLTRFVRFPLTHAERLMLIDRNARMGLPGVIGLIDGTIIRITPPPRPNAHYFSRKGSTSLDVMIVCDTDLNILNVNARFPGSSHDSHVYNNSALRDVMEAAFREDH
ncbi:Putative nuclease [Frankliniella fusca]|uniref:Nuclease n=1 Tax=Frankliniella fusca TaxID=407009 RepID=A0AAE1LJD4_9NEOP|nr:Putative nuclease [Frankliniella fusca]